MLISVMPRPPWLRFPLRQYQRDDRGHPHAAYGAVAGARAGVEPGGDLSGGGLLDPACLGGDSQSVEFAPLPVPILPSKEARPD
jgi:hypothetical protein